VIGLEDGRVRIEPYDPAWKTAFQEEARRLRAALREGILGVEHIGSTAVPGLPAKPILDLMAEVTALQEAHRLRPAVVDLGYEYRERDDVPDRLYFVLRPREGWHSHHLSLATAGSTFWRTHLLFRDHLRARPEVRDAYARLKAKLAAEHPRDRLAYLDGKSVFIREILRQAGGGQE
jgi:GrpB-like predicted nucleotidyltransferase (UPF0157 family)